MRCALHIEFRNDPGAVLQRLDNVVTEFPGDDVLFIRVGDRHMSAAVDASEAFRGALRALNLSFIET